MVGAISPFQMSCILSMFYSGTLVYAPIRVFNVAGYSGWIAGMVAGVLGALIVLLWVKTSVLFPGKSLPEYAMTALGPALGRIVNVALAVYFVSEVAFDARAISEVMDRLMPETPLIVFISMSLAFAVIAGRRGPGVIGRTAIIHGVVVAASFFFLYATVIPSIKPDLFLPILESGWGPVLNASVTPAAFFGQGIIVAMLIPLLSRSAPQMERARSAKQGPGGQMAKAALRAALLGTALMWLYAQSYLVLTQGVIGPIDASRLEIPSLTLARGIEIGTYVERVESALVAVWLPSIILKLTVFLYAASQTTRHLVGAESFRSIHIALAALAAPLALAISDNPLELIRLSNGTWSLFALIAQTAPALLILGASAAKGVFVGANTP